ncbi:MAG: hypothetical protein ACK5MP_03360 [Nostocoides sp.]
MPHPAAALPLHLLHQAPFTVKEARAAGIGRSRLRAIDLQRPTWGVRRTALAEPGFLDAVQAFACALPEDCVFSHDTAARLHGLPTPRMWQPDEPIHVIRNSNRPKITRNACSGHRGLERREVVTVAGVPATTMLHTWLDLGQWGVFSLVAVADAMLNRMPGLDATDLVDACEGRAGQRGYPTLLQAAGLARRGAASPQESTARVWFHTWGLPEPELNRDLFDETGEWVARPDFTWQRERVVAEYDGDQHRTRRSTWEYERERRAIVEDLGWTYVEMSARTLTRPAVRERLRLRLQSLLMP